MDIVAPLFLCIIAIFILFCYLKQEHSYYYYKLKKNENGDNFMMAKMIEDLKGKTVAVRDIFGVSYQGEVLEIEEKWLKIERKNKKGEIVLKQIVAIDSIASIRFN